MCICESETKHIFSIKEYLRGNVKKPGLKVDMNHVPIKINKKKDR